MYQTILEINNNVSADSLITIKNTIESAFDNRLGKIENSSTGPYCLKFVGDDNEFGCLEIGLFLLKKIQKY